MSMTIVLESGLQIVLAVIFAWHAYSGLRSGRFSLGVWSGHERWATKREDPRAYWLWMGLSGTLTIVCFGLGVSHFIIP